MDRGTRGAYSALLHGAEVDVCIVHPATLIPTLLSCTGFGGCTDLGARDAYSAILHVLRLVDWSRNP